VGAHAKLDNCGGTPFLDCWKTTWIQNDETTSTVTSYCYLAPNANERWGFGSRQMGPRTGRKLPQIENNMKIEASISLRRTDEEVKVHGEPKFVPTESAAQSTLP
jgi:hypothetical protein